MNNMNDTQIETKDGFVPFLLNFLSQAIINDDNQNGCKPRFAASIRLKNLIKYRWKQVIKSFVYSSNK